QPGEARERRDSDNVPPELVRMHTRWRAGLTEMDPLMPDCDQRARNGVTGRIADCAVHELPIRRLMPLEVNGRQAVSLAGNDTNVEQSLVCDSKLLVLRAT